MTEYIDKTEVLEILDNQYLLPFRKEERLRGLKSKNPWQIVYAELSELNLLMGSHDALHGNEHFMYGLNTVMEIIASNAGKYDEYDAIWSHNMIESEKRALANSIKLQYAKKENDDNDIDDDWYDNWESDRDRGREE